MPPHAINQPKRVPVRLVLALTLSFAAQTLFAADVRQPNIGDAVRDANAPIAPARQAPPPAPVILQQEEAPMTLPEGGKIFIRDFRVEGAEFIDAKELSGPLEPYRNRDLTIGQINEAANRITVLVRSKGYLVARAYVPKQNVRDGVLAIHVIAGKYGRFQMKNGTRISGAFLQRTFERAKAASDVVTKEGLERPMLLVSTMPGAQMPLVSIGPGTQAGTSDFLIETQAAERAKGYVSADNYGSRFTGRNRLSAGVDINNPFGIADRFSLSGISSRGAGLQNARGAYSFPLSSNGLRAEVAASKTTYKLGDQFADLDATGVATSVDATLSYPIRRTREDSVYLSLNVAGKHLRDDIAVVATTVAKRARVATLRLDRETYGTLFGYGFYAVVGGGLTVGQLDFDDPAQRAANVAGANTAGNYSKVGASFNANLAFDEKWSLSALAAVQQSLGKNLDGSEQFSVSGPAGIKSYPDGVVSDNGYLVGAEIKYALAPVGDATQQLGVFYNQGAVRPENGAFTTIGRIAISDAGLGYYVTGKSLFGRVQVAQTLGKQQETGAYNNHLKLLAQAGLRF